MTFRSWEGVDDGEQKVATTAVLFITKKKLSFISSSERVYLREGEINGGKFFLFQKNHSPLRILSQLYLSCLCAKPFYSHSLFVF